MSEPQWSDFQTVKVLGSSVAKAEDGTKALLLETDQLGTIAFEVDQETIALLLKQLAQAAQESRPLDAPEVQAEKPESAGQ